MLPPFLKPKQSSSIVMVSHKADGKSEPMGEEGEHSAGMMSAAEDLLAAIANKDAKAVASALKAANDMCEDESMSDEQS